MIVITGSYSGTSGATSCTLCPATPSLSCPVGAVAPIPTVNVSAGTGNLDTPVQMQPEKYSQAAGEAALNDAYSTVFSVSGSLFFLILVLFLLSRKVDALRDIIQWRKMDLLFVAKHPAATRPHLDVPANERWKELFQNEWKTSLGGVMTLISIVLLFGVGLLLGLPLRYTNILETRSLIPSLDVNQNILNQFGSFLTADLTLNGYADNCVVVSTPLGEWGPCNALIQLETPNIKIIGSAAGGENFMRCKYLSNPNMCKLEWKCPMCSITSSPASLAFSFQQSFAYATSIFWNLTSDAGVIPTQFSQVSHTLRPSFFGQSSSLVFRGPSQTVISIGTVRSLFTSDVGSNRGYQLSYVGAIPGTLSSGPQFLQNYGLKIAFNYTLDSALFSVVQNSLITVPAVLSNISGALAGVLGLMASVLAFIESKFLASKYVRADNAVDKAGQAIADQYVDSTGRVNNKLLGRKSVMMEGAGALMRSSSSLSVFDKHTVPTLSTDVSVLSERRTAVSSSRGTSHLANATLVVPFNAGMRMVPPRSPHFASQATATKSTLNVRDSG